jgi:hypothetical protein
VSIDQLEDIEHGLTVRDPWAQAIVWGPSRIYNCDERPPDEIIGQRVAVQTAKEVDEEAWRQMRLPSPSDLWSEYVPQRLAAARQQTNSRHHPGQIIGTVRIAGWWSYSGGGSSQCHVPCEESCFQDRVAQEKQPHLDPWWQGPVGWLLADPQPLDEPVPARGLPGIWSVDKQVEVVS